MYEMATRIYEDGTPKTKHNTSNVQLYIDEAEGTAHSRSYYCVTQATRGWPSTHTVQQPHWPCGLQPSLADVMPRSVRM